MVLEDEKPSFFAAVNVELGNVVTVPSELIFTGAAYVVVGS